MSNLIVTISPPTPNGDLHIGHLAGPFLSADVFARIHRANGRDVTLICYSDDYQSYLLRKARELGVSPAELCDKNADLIVESLKMVSIDLDFFFKSNGSKTFSGIVNKYYDSLKAKSLIRSRACQVPYCKKCNVLGYEAFAWGECDMCGSGSDASQCEICAAATDIEKIQNYKCTLCGSTPIFKKIEREYWAIGECYPQLRHYYANSKLRRSLRSFLDSQLKDESKEWFIDRPGDAGIPISGDKIIHTWFSGLSGYKATLYEYLATKGETQCFGDLWSRDDTDIAMFFGFDCSFSHAITYAAQLLCSDTDPVRVVHYTNRFLKLNGDDFSTSRNHAIWIRELASQYPSDAIRFYLALHCPEDEVTNFSAATFKEWYANWYQPFVLKMEDLTDNGVESSGGGRIVSILQGIWASASDMHNYSLVNYSTRLKGVADEIMSDGVVLKPDELGLFFKCMRPMMPNLVKMLSYNISQVSA